MEVQREAFNGLMEYYKQLPTNIKRAEIINEIEEMISNYSKLCVKLEILPDMGLNREMLNTNRANLTEEEFLHAVFAYLNTLQDINSQFIDKISSILIDRK